MSGSISTKHEGVKSCNDPACSGVAWENSTGCTNCKKKKKIKIIKKYKATSHAWPRNYHDYPSIESLVSNTSEFNFLLMKTPGNISNSSCI